MILKVGDVLSYRFNSELTGIIVNFDINRSSCVSIYDIKMFMLNSHQIEDYAVYKHTNIWVKII